jgi:hypothetical protein
MVLSSSQSLSPSPKTHIPHTALVQPPTEIGKSTRHSSRNRSARSTPVSDDPPEQVNVQVVVALPSHRKNSIETDDVDQAPRVPGEYSHNVLGSEGLESMLIDELTHYKLRCKKAEKECEKLKLERRINESLESSRNRLDDQAKVLLEKEWQIISLRKRRHTLTDMKKYLAIGSIETGASNEKLMSVKFQELKEQLPKILVTDGARVPAIGHLRRSSAELDDILSTLFPTHSTREVDMVRDSAPPLTLYELVQALIGAAIHLWIFQKEFLVQTLVNTPLLQRYRDYITNLCTY